MITCPNSTCGKTFQNPIRAENLCARDKQVYDACPYCLTEITAENDATEVEPKEDIHDNIEKEHLPEPYVEKNQVSPEPKVQGCTHTFGYLSQRSSKEKIPEECMVCESIVQCMLRKVTG